MFVKSIDTWPALAVSEVVVYFSWPSGLAARLSVCAALELVEGAAGVVVVFAGVDAVVGVVDVVVAALAGLGDGAYGLWLEEVLVLLDAAGVDEEEELVFDEELPQPASSTSPAISTSELERILVMAAICGFTADPPYGAIIDC